MVDALATTITITPSFNKNDKPEGPNPNNLNHTKSFTLTVTVNGIPVNEYCKIDVELKDVTKWKGTCANYPKSGANTQRDLKFLRSDYINARGEKITGWDYHGETHISYKTTTENPEPTVTKTVNVRSYDYGAYGKLEVTVRKKGWVLYRTVIAGPTTQTIPIDKNGNQIADGWENDDTQPHILPNGKNGYNPAADDENVLNTNHGDAFSVFDEYRGVWLNGSDGHKRLKPSEKDVLIAPEDEDGSESTNTANDMWSYGKGRAGVMPGHIFHKVHPNYVKRPFDNVVVTNSGGSIIGYQINPNRDIGWVNVNSEGSLLASNKIPGFKRVYAVRIKKNRSLAQGKKGIAPSTPNTPSPQTCVFVYYNRIRNEFPNQSNLNTIVSGVIGHETGHCVNLDHCPVPFSPQNNCLMQKTFTSLGDASDPFLAHHNPAYDVAAPAGATVPPYHNPANPGTSQVGVEVINDPSGTTPESPAPGTTTQPPSTPPSTSQTPTSSVISTNTGTSSTYGCGYNAEYDYCTDTGTCTTRTDATAVGMCGHRWCCCAPDTTSTTTTTTPSTTTTTYVTSPNTGNSPNGCGYNAEFDYCTDTGTCTTRSGEFGIGVCGHRWCCCAPEGAETPSTPSTSVTSPNPGPSHYGCDYNAEYDYCTDTGTCTTRSGEFGIGMCGHRWCCCAPE